MADISDVMDALEQVAITTCYPNGTASASISGKPIDIAQGWVVAEDLDALLTAGQSAVSIYAMPSSTSKLPVPLTGTGDGILVAPIHGMSAIETTTGFALTGAPGPGEYATAIVNGAVYSAAAGSGDTAVTIMSALASQIPQATFNGASITIAELHSLIVRIGAPGTIGRVIDRQRQIIVIGTWAPNPADRSVIGAALRIAIAQNLVVSMPDTSQSIWIAQTENLIDKYQNELAYRRDLNVQCQWDTVETFAGYEVTSVNVTINPGPASLTKAY